MATSAQQVNSHIADWLELQKQPWNRLRYTIHRANLARHMPPGTLNILDVGGGSGDDALPWAEAGHRVTVLDYSEKMLELAAEQAKMRGVSDRITPQLADLSALTDLYPTPRFDVVLCHNVIQYVGDAAEAIRLICQPLKPSGIVSIIAANRYAESLQAATLRMDLDEAYAMIDVREKANPVFDTQGKRFAGEEVAEWLGAGDCELLGHYGVRCVMDYIADNDRKHDPEFYAKLERLELAMSDKYPYYLIARFFQLIGQKRSAL